MDGEGGEDTAAVDVGSEDTDDASTVVGAIVGAGTAAVRLAIDVSGAFASVPGKSSSSLVRGSIPVA